MSEITARDIFAASQKAERMKYRNRDGLVAKAFRQQPGLLSFVADLSGAGLPADRIAFLYELVTVCVQAMNEVRGGYVVNRHIRRPPSINPPSHAGGNECDKNSLHGTLEDDQLFDYAVRRVNNFLAYRKPHNSDALMRDAVSTIVRVVQSSSI